MKPIVMATPLIALDAVAVDTETTGLDTAKARIVQIGAVRVAAGQARTDQPFEMLVDPGIPIPSASARIHGITNAVVRNARGFAEAFEAFRDFTAGRVLIGHSIGFDLAVMEREAARAGLAWKKPRSLCVRLLAAAVDPRLPDYSLDTIANWLGTAVSGRHSALGDAMAAAEIFVALLPRLQDRGIRTLAEAERAILVQTTAVEQHVRAGWAEPASRPEETRALGAVDPFAYRHRMAELMKAPPVVVRSAASVREVLGVLAERRIGSALVSDSGRPGEPIGRYGIVTERDLLRRFAAGQESAFALEIGALATRPVVSVREQAFAYRAIGRMARLGIRHLAVRTEAGLLAGVVSARDLLRLRARAAIDLDDRIDASETAAELATSWSMLPAVADTLIAEDLEARIVAEIVSDELCAMTRRAAILSEQSMRADGLGEPPCPYALLVLGSGGRGESLLAADQDNAIVFSEGEPDGPADRWFAELGGRLSAILDQAGIPFCKGGVMAMNSGFRGSVALWRSRIDEWVRRSRPEDLLNVDIFFDMRPVHGDHAMAEMLFDQAYDRGSEDADFAKLLGQSLDGLGNPFTLFGSLQSENGRIDLKKFGLFPVVATARTLAIRHGIRARSTKARLEGLLARDVGGDADLAAMLSGHTFLLGLMLAQQSADLHAGIPVSNKVATGNLDRPTLARVRSVLKSLQSAPALVRDLMFGGP